MSSSNRVLISRESAEVFLKPDPEALRRRDAFFARLEQECVYRREGGRLVREIPDWDAADGAPTIGFSAGGNHAALPVSEKPCERASQSLSTDVPDVPLTVVYGQVRNAAMNPA